MQPVKIRKKVIFGLFVATFLFVYNYLPPASVKKENPVDYEEIQNEYSWMDNSKDVYFGNPVLNTSIADELSQKVKLICLVTTTNANLLTKAKAVNDTWGKRCDKIIFVTSFPSGVSMTISFDYLDTRTHLTRKTMLSLRHLYQHYLSEYQWFMKADDDTYIVMENLKLLLSKCDSKKPIYLGHHFKVHLKQGYMSGGAGYVMSQTALRMLVEDGLNRQKCTMDGHDEDVDVGRCLETVGVRTYSTTDKYGRESFQAFHLLEYIKGPAPIYLFQYMHKPPRTGKDCCSQLPISYHYMKPGMMYVIEYFLYHATIYGRQLGYIGDDFFKEEISRLDKNPDSILIPFGTGLSELVMTTPNIRRVAEKWSGQRT